jgi:aminoglycoside 3-N-acetyltransferase
VRSLHPTHSQAAIGERADEFTRDHLKVGAVGAGSPYDLIAQAGGYVVLLGVTHIANTTIHVGEDYAGMRKLGREHFLTFKVRLPDGSVVEKQQDNSNSCSSGFNVLELPLRLRGKLRAFRLGSAASTITRGKELIDTTVELIGQHPDITRCMQPGCAHCDAWRRLQDEGS